MARPVLVGATGLGGTTGSVGGAIGFWRRDGLGGSGRHDGVRAARKRLWGGTTGSGRSVGAAAVPAMAALRVEAVPSWRRRRRGSRRGVWHRRGAGGNGVLANTTIWIAGDSTVMTYAAGNTSGNNMVSIFGWGQELGQFLPARKSPSTIRRSADAVSRSSCGRWPETAPATCCASASTRAILSSSWTHPAITIDTSQWAAIKNGIKAGDFFAHSVRHQR